MTLMPVTFSVMASYRRFLFLALLRKFTSQECSTSYWGSAIFSFPITAEVYMPVLYRKSSAHCSALSGVEIQFGSSHRSFHSVLHPDVSSIRLWCCTPAAITFQQVTGLSFPLTMVLTGVVCTFYTALGGIKAVMWTDLVQMIIVFVAFCTLVVMATMEVGGFERVFEMAAAGDRLNFFNFNPDPTVRHSFWTLLFGGTGMCLTIYSANQAQLPALPETAQPNAAHISVPLLPLPGGLVIYAFYSDLRPLLVRDIVKRRPALPALVASPVLSPTGVTEIVPQPVRHVGGPLLLCQFLGILVPWCNRYWPPLT
uniref:Aa_trans domain-containing protein n=1 Tax=Macrostomum lignano TaxID=282301 RepID=A0A1I8FHJ2_9PLAT